MNEVEHEYVEEIQVECQGGNSQNFLQKVLKIFFNFRPQNLEIIMAKSI